MVLLNIFDQKTMRGVRGTRSFKIGIFGERAMLREGYPVKTSRFHHFHRNVVFQRMPLKQILTIQLFFPKKWSFALLNVYAAL